MKVIRPGRSQSGWAGEFLCTGDGNGGGGCGAKLLVEQGDLFRTEANHFDETTFYTTFVCCQCAVKTDLKPKDVPPSFNLPSEKEWFDQWDKDKEAEDFEKGKAEVKRITRKTRKTKIGFGGE